LKEKKIENETVFKDIGTGSAFAPVLYVFVFVSAH